jgi:hypothetical protein
MKKTKKQVEKTTEESPSKEVKSMLRKTEVTQNFVVDKVEIYKPNTSGKQGLHKVAIYKNGEGGVISIDVNFVVNQIKVKFENLEHHAYVGMPFITFMREAKSIAG